MLFSPALFRLFDNQNFSFIKKQEKKKSGSYCCTTFTTFAPPQEQLMSNRFAHTRTIQRVLMPPKLALNQLLVAQVPVFSRGLNFNKCQPRLQLRCCLEQRTRQSTKRVSKKWRDATRRGETRRNETRRVVCRAT